MGDRAQNEVLQIAPKRGTLSRATVSRRLKAEIDRLREEIDATYHLTAAEYIAVKRVALANILAENAVRRALQGKCSISDATRAQGAARRARKDLPKVVLPKPEFLEHLGRSA